MLTLAQQASHTPSASNRQELSTNLRADPPSPFAEVDVRPGHLPAGPLHVCHHLCGWGRQHLPQRSGETYISRQPECGPVHGHAGARIDHIPGVPEKVGQAPVAGTETDEWPRCVAAGSACLSISKSVCPNGFTGLTYHEHVVAVIAWVQNRVEGACGLHAAGPGTRPSLHLVPRRRQMKCSESQHDPFGFQTR